MNNNFQKLTDRAEDITSFIEGLLKKYNLEKKQEEVFNLAIASKNPEESGKLFNQLPSFKIIEIIEKLYLKETSERDLPEILKSELEIDSKVAKEMAHEINMEGLEIYKALVRKKVAPEVEEKIPPKKISLGKEAAPSKISLERPIIPPKEPKEPSSKFTVAPKNDLYRELPPEEELRPKF